MPLAKPRTSLSMIKPEQKVCKPEKEVQDPLDNIIRQAMGKDPFVSFSRASDNRVQWIQLLHALDQQGANKLSKCSKPLNGVDGKERTRELCNGISLLSSEMNGFKDNTHTKGTGSPVKGTKLSPEHVHHQKLPEIVALAAAKANGENEKYFPGWPLSLPSKVQMQKCEKCSREFCSPINYRRHIRIHRRSLNIDKDSSKDRDYLGSFWDKLSTEEAREIMSFKDVILEEVPGSTIIKSLASFVQNPGFISLPQSYIKAAAAILDIIQARPSRLAISSKELFAILDDASERTFLCAGTAVSMQRFVFDGEAAKIGLEAKNIVACTSFLIEQKLVAAWLADKDAEALRCQKLLVEEEEAAQKRQAELLEKRRLKKLRHKEQKLRDRGDDDTANDVVNDSSTPIETPSSPVPIEVEPECRELSCESLSSLVPAVSTDADGDNHGVNNGDLARSMELETGHFYDPMNLDPSGLHGTNQKATYAFAKRYLDFHHRQTVKQSRYAQNGFTSGAETLHKSVANQKFGGFKDQKIVQINGHKVWTRKSKMEKEGQEVGKGKSEVHEQLEESKKREVLIGSISVAISKHKGPEHDTVDTVVAIETQHQECSGSNGLVQPTAEQQAAKRNPISEKWGKSDCGQTCTNQSKMKLWRPVGMTGCTRNEGGGSILEQSDGLSCDRRDACPNNAVEKLIESSDATESCHRPLENDREASDRCRNSSDQAVNDNLINQTGVTLFLSRDAEIFLIQRWKEAISGDHVTVVVSPDVEVYLSSVHPQISSADPTPSVGPENSLLMERNGSLNDEANVVGGTRNQMAGGGHQSGVNVGLKLAFQTKTAKPNLLKYIPKQKVGAD